MGVAVARSGGIRASLGRAVLRFGSELCTVPQLPRGQRRGAAARACLHRGLSSARKQAGFDKRGEGEG